MSGCKDNNGGCGDCIPVGPIGPIGPTGNTGPKGNDGNGVLASYVSDGVTLIGGVLYPLNTLVFQLVNLSFISSGVLYPTPPLVWQPIALVNSWGTNPTDIPEYATSNGFIYFRGQLADTGTDAKFSSILTIGNTKQLISRISDADSSSPGASSNFVIEANGDLKITTFTAFGTSGNWLLDSLPPISIR